jgi:metal-dependent amidase/aminoacylase/carboxypeptidase family protein
VIADFLGPGAWNPDVPRSMGAEDFSYYLEKAPGVFLRLGLGERHAPLHTSAFDFNDEALETGMLALAALALDALQRGA